jgi:acyl-CoA synthetase (AMP-forming)/AMP-acid ligase II
VNLGSLLAEHPFGDDQPLLHGLERHLTAGEARAAVAERAEQLAAAGVSAGRPVTVRHESGVDTVVSMFAVWAAGGVFVPLNPRLPAAEAARVEADTGAAARIDDTGVTALDGAVTHDAGVAFVLWTSGTTGRPTPILHHHDAYLEIIDRVLGPLRGSSSPTAQTPTSGEPAAQAQAAKTPSPNLIPVSMALNAGIYNALFGLRAGAEVVLMDRFDPIDFATLVARHRIRSTVLPPPAMVMLTDAPILDDLSPLRYVRSITAPLSPFQARRFIDRFGVTVLNGYGQAELGEVVGWTAADARDHPERLGAAGRPHPGVSVRVDDPDGNGVGELHVRPPVAPSDGVRAGLGDRLGADGFVRTGDLARIDDAGFVWIEGRIGDLVNRGGNKVPPVEVEEVLEAVPGVREAAVVGEPDDRLGEVPVAYVVADDAVTDDILDAACRAALVPYKVPVRYERVAALPRSEVGKILKRELGRR